MLGFCRAPHPRSPLPCTHLAAASNPQAYIAACLQPLLSSPGLNKHQAELVGGTLKPGLPPQLLPDVLAAACAACSPARLPANSGAGGAAPAALPGGSGWNEHTVGVLQAVLNSKPALSSSVVGQLAGALAAAVSPAGSSGAGGGAAELASSPKFAKVVLSLVKQYPAEAAEAKQQLLAAAQACKSFMAKSLLAAVGKL